MNRAFLRRCLRFQNDSRRTEDDRFLSFPCCFVQFLWSYVYPSASLVHAHMHGFDALFCILHLCSAHDSLLVRQYTIYASTLRSQSDIDAWGIVWECGLSCQINLIRSTSMYGVSMVRSMYNPAKVQRDINSMGPVTKDACLFSSTNWWPLALVWKMKLKQIITIIEREDEMISYEVRPLNVLIHDY